MATSVDATTPADDQIRVMVVDDSAVIRGLLTKLLESDPEIKVVATGGNGQIAINTARRTPIDVVVLDIEMPVMDGLTALPELLKTRPGVRVVIASTLTARGADISLRALQAGASDYVTKPSSTRDVHSGDAFKRELTDKVKSLGGPALRSRMRQRGRESGTGTRSGAPSARTTTSAATTTRAAPAAAPPPKESAVGSAKAAPHSPKEISLRKGTPALPEVIAIGSSTGGPQALFEVLGHLKAGVKQPILITQHMPATFTAILADHIARITGLPCKEAAEGDVLEPGHAYVAAGDWHMTVSSDRPRRLSLNQGPPENFCRPSVDPMLRSTAAAYGRHVLVVILTGMGHDGLAGARGVVDAGGTVIAQDEESSVVWGMPGAVATAGLCTAVLPVKEIGPYVRKLAVRTAA
jgi:two-component system chemotaxis response regulator CheB